VHDTQTLKHLLDAVRVNTDAAQRLQSMSELRMALLSEAERILVHDEFPILPVYVYVTSDMAKPTVKGFYSELTGSDGTKRPNLRSIHPLRGVSIESGAR
jgi:ABC-type oligopeptide transport system substrate-binding subunit